MSKLWEKRKAPTPLDWNTCISDDTPLDQVQQQQATTTNTETLESHKILTMQKYCKLFSDSVNMLRKKLEEANDDPNPILVWDKDDEEAMDFVVAASNLRCYIFGIGLKTKFETKCN
jgi:ubiquitin-like 1-activating enzyme E1 B